ncbi:MAG: MipA/OmpV family protein [Pseudomonadota bacterium]
MNFLSKARVSALALGVMLVLPVAYGSDQQPEDQQSTQAGVVLPRWEFGLAAAALKVPAYPSSASSSERQFLVPWFVYRGDKVRLQDGGAKLIALENERVTIDISIAGSLNANSEDAPLRAGMPNLDYLLELGPKLDVRLFDKSLDNGQRQLLSWSTALRAAVSTDFKSARGRGAVLGSQLRYRHRGLANDRVSWSASLTSTWAAESLLDYIYQVDDAFVTADRPAYDARAGYVGTRLSFGLFSEINDRWSVYLGLSSSIHNSAANRDSPLFERDNTVSVFGGVSWEIKRSSQTIRVLDE